MLDEPVPVPERGFALSPCGTSEAAYERSVGLLVLATGYGLRLACSDAAVAVFVVLLSLLLLCASLEAVPKVGGLGATKGTNRRVDA